MAAAKKVKEATTPTTEATPAEGKSAPKRASKKAATAKVDVKPKAKAEVATVMAATEPVAEAKAEVATVKVETKPQVKPQPKAALPKVMAEPPKILTTDEVIARAGACLEHPHFDEINGTALVEFKKFEETGVPTDGTRWAIDIAERVLKGKEVSAAKEAEAAANQAYIDQNGAEIVRRAIVCTKSMYWENLRLGDGKHHPPLRRMRFVEQAAAGNLTPNNVHDAYEALVTLEGVLDRKQSVVFRDGQAVSIRPIPKGTGLKQRRGFGYAS